MSNPVAASWQKLSGRTRTITAIVVFGLIGGGGAVAFHLAMHAIYAHGLQALAARSTVVFLLGSLGVILAGSAITGWLLTRFCPEAAGSGIPQVKLAFWRDAGAISWRVTWVKFVAGVLSVGCGNSLGREGPSVQLAAGLAANSAHLLGIPRHKRRSAAAAGGAAGLAAAFNTPIAAVTFVLEEIIGDLNSRLLGPILLASILGALVAHGILGAQPAFTLHDPGAPGWRGYVLTPFIAAGAALVGCLFQKLALGLRARQRRLQKLPPWMRPTMGGLAVWLIGARVFLLTGHLGVFSLGYDDLSLALDGDLGWQIAAILLGAKLLATVLSYVLGGCGGIFSPTLFFGGTAGAMMAGLVGLALPLTHGDEVTLAIVGMAACLGGVVRAPITGILIVFEMTHDFALVPALMVGALVSQGVSRLITPRNFYEELLEQDGHHVERVMPPRSLRHWLELPVGRIANFAPVALTDLSSTAISRALAEHRFQRFPVVLGGKLAGVVSRAALRATVRDGTSPALDEDVVTCTPDTRLREAEIRIIDSSGHFAVVVDRRGPDAAVLGVLTLHDLLRAEIAFAREHED